MSEMLIAGAMLTDRKLFLQFERSAVCLNSCEGRIRLPAMAQGVPGLRTAKKHPSAWLGALTIDWSYKWFLLDRRYAPSGATRMAGSASAGLDFSTG
jgi:hypothetical protein